MAFRRRGVEVSVDTTGPAEFDLALYEVPAEAVTLIERSLSELPLGGDDVPHGPVLRRELGDWWAYFLITEQGGDIIVLLVRVVPKATPAPSVRDIVDLVATLRGASGV